MKNKRTDSGGQTTNSPYIGSSKQAELWQVNNPNIKTGYRIGYNTNRLAFKSLFQIHNETGNVWSHLLGALLFVAMGFYVTMFMRQSKVLLKGECPVNDLGNCSIE